MATVESAQFARYFELFPELTPTQAMTCILFSMGLAIPTIADLRDVSHETVRKVLQDARQKLDLSELVCSQERRSGKAHHGHDGAAYRFTGG